MAQNRSPNRPQKFSKFVDRDGFLTELAFQTLDQIWRQVAAGFVVVPCDAVGKNTITLTPRLHKEGGAELANYMVFSFVAAQTSDGSVTAQLTADGVFFKVYKDAGAAQAGSGDVVANSLYLAIFNSALDGGNGGFVVK